MYDADRDSKQYILEYQEKFSPFIPRLLIHDKSKAAAGGETVAALAKALDIKLFQEVNLSAEHVPLKELIDAFCLTATEPYRGISDKGLEELRSAKFAGRGMSPAGTLALVGIIVSIAGAAFYKFIFKASQHT